MKPMTLPSKPLRRMALGLAGKHLTGAQRAEAVAWLREPRRSAVDLHGFVDRMVAAHQQPGHETGATS